MEVNLTGSWYSRVYKLKGYLLPLDGSTEGLSMEVSALYCLSTVERQLIESFIRDTLRGNYPGCGREIKENVSMLQLRSLSSL